MAYKRVREKLLITGSCVSEAVYHEMEKMKAVTPTVKAALTKLRTDLLAIQGNNDLSREGKQKQLDAARQLATTTIEDALQAAQSAKESAVGFLTEALADHHEDATERLTALMEHNQAWSRAERMLKGGAEPHTLIQQAETAKDRATLRALRAELPSYLYGEDPTLLKEYQGMIDQAEYPLLPPVEKAARSLLTEVEQGMYNNTLSLHQAKSVMGDAPSAKNENGAVMLDWNGATENVPF